MTVEEKAAQYASSIDNFSDEIYDGFIAGYTMRDGESQWVSVDIEPPQYYKPVQCLSKDNNWQCVAWRASDGDNDIYTIFQTDFVVYDITHWMPLPNLPQPP